MAEVTKTYDEVKRNSEISLDKVGDKLRVKCTYRYYNDEAAVMAFGLGTCHREVDWASVPQNVKDALTAIDAYMQTAMDEDAGLVS